MPEMLTERVLVVPTAVFHRVGHFQGFAHNADRFLDELLRREHTSYRPRGEVENDPSFKQLIPYVIFRYRDEGGRELVFQYTRGTGQGEGRLHRKKSVGIGGHISDADTGPHVDTGPHRKADSRDEAGSDDAARGPYHEGMRRELEEEVIVDTPYTSQCVGLINDDQTDVGRVHLGVVHRFDVERPNVKPRESEILESGFRPVEELLADLSGFETWSEICLRALFGERTGS